MLCKIAKSLRCVLCALNVSLPCEGGDERNKPVGLVAEPTYAGRFLKAWTARLDDPNPARRCAAARALGAIGPDARAAVPDLIRTLGDDDSSVRTEAAMALGRIGPAAAAATPEMLATLRQASYFDGGMIGPSLARLGSAAVPLLLEATRDPAGNARSESIRALRLIGPAAHGALRRLEELARDPKDPDRVEAAFGLWTIGHRPEAISVLADALAHPHEHIRIKGAEYLGAIGFHAEPAVPSMIRALNDNSFPVRGTTAIALGKIGAVAKAAIPAILHTPGPAGPGPIFAIPAAAIGEGAVPTLIEGLDDPGNGPRWTAAEALGRIGPRAQAAVPALTRMSTSAKVTGRVIAATALWRIAVAKRIVPILVEAARPAKGRDLGNRYAALDALGEIDPAAAEAVPALIKQLAVENEINAYKVVDALGKIGPAAGAAIEPLERISARSQNSSLRMSANLALWRITKGEKGLGGLIKELKEGDNMARNSALMALCQIGHGAGPAVPAVAELLRSNSPDFSLIVGTLGDIGPPAKSTLPLLIQIFNDDALLDKDRVADAIRAIDPAVAKSLGIR